MDQLIKCQNSDKMVCQLAEIETRTSVLQRTGNNTVTSAFAIKIDIREINYGLD
jgi:hypothetical protein